MGTKPGVKRKLSLNDKAEAVDHFNIGDVVKVCSGQRSLIFVYV